jgi:hypothetical protein
MVELDRFGVSKERFCFVELIVLEDNLNMGQKFILILLIFIIIVNACSFTFVAEFNILATERRRVFSCSLSSSLLGMA